MGEPADIEEMRRIVAEHDMATLANRKARAAAAVQPARDYHESDEFRAFVAKTEEVKIAVARFPQLASLLNNISQTCALIPEFTNRAENEELAQITGLETAQPAAE